MHDAGLGHGMTRIGDDAQIGFRPGAREIVGNLDRGDNVVTAVHNHARDRTQTLCIGDQLVVDMEEAAIDEVVALDAGEGERIVVLGDAAHPIGIGK